MMKKKQRVLRRSLQKSSQETLSFGKHLQELRLRILFVAMCVLGFSLVGYIIREDIFAFLIAPLGKSLYYSSPSGGFNFVIKISLFFGILCTVPILIYNLLRFVLPAFPQKIGKSLTLLTLFSAFLTLAGIVFAYKVTLPAAIKFLEQFKQVGLESLISTDEYFSFVTRYLLGFGVLFQLPLVMLAVNAIYKLSIEKLFSFSKWVIFVSFVASAVITPTPDIFNMSLMAIPVITLYYLSCFVIVLINTRRT